MSLKLRILVTWLMIGWIGSPDEIQAHHHEIQLPKSYGEVQRLVPPNLSYSEDETPEPDAATQSNDAYSVDGDGSIKQRQPPMLGSKASGSSANVVQYIWSIQNFSSMLTSEQELVFSPRFYLNEPGFRLQLLLVTNTTYSDGISYLGVFFRIVAGDYDAEIEWPYKHRTILSVLKHEDLKEWTNKAVLGNYENLRSKYNHTITPNLDECRLRSAFLRPNSDVEFSSNTDGCGNRRHIPLKALETEMYLRDDTLIILMQVDMDPDVNEKTFQRATMSLRYNEMVSNYVWTIRGFNTEKNESVSSGKIVILNAEPFYTHPNGYLIQLFLTILPKRSAFAVSMAFVQGDYDRYLQWPFPYHFEMAIEDQSPDYWKRDLSIKVKPSNSDCGTEPFGQPGPQPEFCFLTIQSLQVLSLTHYNFLLNDTLKIRFTTRFERYSSRQRSSILLRNNRLVSEFNWLIPGLVARFERLIKEQKAFGGHESGGNLSSPSLFRRTHRFVSDEFYTNGQGYLCQLVLTVSIHHVPAVEHIRNLTISMNDADADDGKTRTTSINDDGATTESSAVHQPTSQDVLVFGLELVIIEGEYDRFLEWPFNKAYELAIVGYKALQNQPSTQPPEAEQTNNSNNGTNNNNSGEQFYFDKIHDDDGQHSQSSKTDSKLIVPMDQVESGQCPMESFRKPIKLNPPCGIRDFIQMDLNQEPPEDVQPNRINKNQKLSKDIPMAKNPNVGTGTGMWKNSQHFEMGSLSKTEDDLHLRVRIHL